MKKSLAWWELARIEGEASRHNARARAEQLAHVQKLRDSGWLTEEDATLEVQKTALLPDVCDYVTLRGARILLRDLAAAGFLERQWVGFAAYGPTVLVTRPLGGASWVEVVRAFQAHERLTGEEP